MKSNKLTPYKGKLKLGSEVFIVSGKTNQSISKGKVLSLVEQNDGSLILKVDRYDGKVCQGHSTMIELPPERGETWGRRKWVSKFLKDNKDAIYRAGGWGYKSYYLVPCKVVWKEML